MHTRRSTTLFYCLLPALLLAACSDPSGPARVNNNNNSSTTGTPSTLELRNGNGQTGVVSQPVLLEPTVVVRNQDGALLSGATVTFVVVQGGGTVQFATATTNAQGIASSGDWTLGALPGVNILEARVGSLTPVRFTATGDSPYKLEVRYIGTPTATQRAAVENAVTRWRSVILSELDNVPVNVPAGRCFASQPAVNETIDDMLIFVEFAAVDGPGKILGQSSPCYVRTSNNLPIFGYLQLDVADAARLESQGLLNALVLHEIAHILGFGTVWEDVSLLSGAGGTNPLFTGSAASAAFHVLSPSGSSVPVENTGGVGTRDSHWRESTFGNELMTGYLNNSANPLSSITIASLKDLGYTVNAASADSYVLAATAATAERIEIHGAEEIILPRWKVDSHGVVQQIIR